MKAQSAHHESNGSDSTLKMNRKREAQSSSSVNYLSLFQLNPLLMHAASVNLSASPSKVSPSDIESAFTSNDLSESTKMKTDSSELLESVLEQKLFNESLDMIQFVENALGGGGGANFEAFNGSYCEPLSDSFLAALTDDQHVQFKIQIPNLLPKMHFVCEIGSRVLFRTIDWLRDLHVFQLFTADVQSEVLKASWIELLIIGIAQTCRDLKPMLVSTLVNYVKSLLILSEQSQKAEGKASVKGKKVKKMLNNIFMLNKFVDCLGRLELDPVEFAHVRLLCFFSPNKVYTMSEANLRQMRAHHERIVESLQSYQQRASRNRLLAIYQALAMLPSFHPKIIEKLFFNILVDFIRIDNVIPYIVNLNSGLMSEQMKSEKTSETDENSPSINSDYYGNYSDGSGEVENGGGRN
jgi:hypothetical protein